MKTIDKWSKIHDDAVIIDQFLEFLNENNLSICNMDQKFEMFYPSRFSKQDLIYKFFKIDQDKLEMQRRELLQMVDKK